MSGGPDAVSGGPDAVSGGPDAVSGGPDAVSGGPDGQGQPFVWDRGDTRGTAVAKARGVMWRPAMRWTAIAAVVAVGATMGMGGCAGAGWTGRPALPRTRAVEAAVRAWAAAADPESPGSLLAHVGAGACGDARDGPARMRCTMRSPRTRLRSWRLPDGGWLLRLYMPDLSDHLHWAEVRAGRGSATALEVAVWSEN